MHSTLLFLAQEAKHLPAYGLMSELFADACLWDDAKRNERFGTVQRSRVWERPCGQSWMEHEKNLHKFVVADHRLAPRSQVHDMSRRVNCLGYTSPRTWPPTILREISCSAAINKGRECCS